LVEVSAAGEHQPNRDNSAIFIHLSALSGLKNVTLAYWGGGGYRAALGEDIKGQETDRTRLIQDEIGGRGSLGVCGCLRVTGAPGSGGD